MSISGRRFELLLPLRFNDGSPVPDDLIADALVELRHRFGAVSSETQRIRIPSPSRQQKSGLRFRRNERPRATTQPLNCGSSRWL